MLAETEERLYTKSDMARAIQRRLAHVKADSAPRAVLDAALDRVRELEERVRQLEEQAKGRR